jgi:TatD DNase family protein
LQFKLGLQIAEAGYYLSIPSNVANSDPSSSFKKLAAALPLDKILTETDSPYLAPTRGVDNTPVTVIESIEVIAKLRNMGMEEFRAVVRNNYRTLFGQ